MEPVIADTARKRGIQADLLHAFNNPIRAEDLDEGFVMLIGGTRSGELLDRRCHRRVRPSDRPRHAGPAEVPEVMTMPRTMQEILDHADELAARFEVHQPGDDVHDGAPLAELRAAVIARSRAEQLVADRVRAARDAGLSWAAIGAMLGTSGEAARQRYSEPSPAHAARRGRST